jgi:hypothetical protein
MKAMVGPRLMSLYPGSYSYGTVVGKVARAMFVGAVW